MRYLLVFISILLIYTVSSDAGEYRNKDTLVYGGYTVTLDTMIHSVHKLAYTNKLYRARLVDNEKKYKYKGVLMRSTCRFRPKCGKDIFYGCPLLFIDYYQRL